MSLRILPALKAVEIAKFMALLDRLWRIWMIRDINFRVNFSPQILVFTFFKRHLFCSVFLSIFMDTEVPKVNCDVSIACNIWSVQRKIFASKMRTCYISVLLSVRGVRRVPYKLKRDQIILKYLNAIERWLIREFVAKLKVKWNWFLLTDLTSSEYDRGIEGAFLNEGFYLFAQFKRNYPTSSKRSITETHLRLRWNC